jgi:hypothetical protein
MYYFGYGSNMLTHRLQARVPSATPVSTAVLDGHELHFHKQSQDGSGKCNIVPVSRSEGRVHGVVFEVSPSGAETLDKVEQRGSGYERRQVPLQGPSSTLHAFAYVAQPAYVDDSLRPYHWYRALVLAGAREHALPPSYIADLESVESRPDPNPSRRQSHYTLLAEAGVPRSKN